MKNALIAAVVLTLASVALAQTAPPALMIKGAKRSEPLDLTTVATDVRIHGPVAETKTTLTFTNPHDRVLEGDLYFPLPEGATVCGYALDIKGVMVDGVAVEKVRARQVFESIVRQGIDPGLVEWTKGNNFKTRVFPIPAKGSRTISVRYVTETGGDYHLPLNYRSKIKDFSLRIEVVRPPAEPKITGGPGKLFFRKGGAGYVARRHLQNATPTEDLTVVVGTPDKTSVLVERGPDGDVYFAIQDAPPIPEARTLRHMPKHVVIYWDASGSRGSQDHKRAVAVLTRCLDSFLPADRKSGGFTVDLVLFRNAVAAPKRFRWANLNWADRKTDRFGLLKTLQAVQYDGGTQLASITPWPDAKTPDFYMLFTDGLSNFGRENPAGLNAPVYAFSDSPRANHPLLRALATKTGGRYFNLKRMTDDQVADAMGRSAFSFLSAAAAGADQMYPKLPQPITGRFMLLGKLTGRDKTARVTVNYGRAGKASLSRPFDVDGRNTPEGTLLRTLWAQKKLADLIVAPEANREEIIHLGKDHGLVTPHTSLLVLDSLDQYVEHRIAPPRSLPKMREQYMHRIDTVAAQAKKKRAAKIETVLKMWNARVAWWDKEFKYPKDFRYTPPKRSKGAGRANGGRNGEATGGEAPTDEAAPAVRPAEDPARPQGVRVNSEREAEAGRDMDEAGEGELSERVGAISDSRARRRVAKRIGEPRRGRPGIAIKPWDPKTPYLAALKDAKPPYDSAQGKQAVWGVYMTNRAEYGTSPAFFLDCADFFHGKDDLDKALQVLSNIAELELENAAMLRVLGHRLVQTRRFDLAVLTFEQVMRLRPDEPQSYRDLALALAARADELGSAQMLILPETTVPIKRATLLQELAKKTGSARVSKEDVDKLLAALGAKSGKDKVVILVDTSASMAVADGKVRGVKHMTVEDARAIRARVRDDYARAIGLLNDVVMKHWQRFPEIEVIALMELNRLIPRAKAFGLKEIPVDKRLIKLLACDMRIVMTWDADNTDIDLHVIEPSGERAYYSHNRTTIGGLVSKDFTRGYGPEEYVLRKAMHGMYAIEAKFYGSASAKLLGAVTLRVDIFTDFAGDDEQHRSITLRLKNKKEIVKVGKVEF